MEGPSGNTHWACVVGATALLVCAARPSFASESELRNSLRQSKRGAQELITACGKLEEASADLHGKLRKLKKASPKVKRIRKKVYGVKKAMPTICARIRTYGYKVRNYVDKVWGSCLACLGRGKCADRRHFERCKGKVETLQEAADELRRWQKKYNYRVGHFQTAIRWLKDL